MRTRTVTALGLILAMLSAGGALADVPTTQIERAVGGWRQEGVASWYGGNFFEGRPRADGKPFHRMDPVAAHRTLPLGTTVRVTVRDTGRSAFVVIRDRGPYVGHRIIDLSEGAAMRLGIRERGTAAVTLEAVR